MEIDLKEADSKYPAQSHLKSASTSSTSLSPPIASLSTCITDVLCQILTYLLPQEVVQVLPCSHFTASLQHHEVLWSTLLSSTFLHPRPPLPSTYPPTSSPSLLFRQYHQEFPSHYRVVYPRIHALHTQLMRFLQEKARWIVPSLNPGLSEAELREALGSGYWEGRGDGPRWQGESLMEWLLFLKFTNGQAMLRRQEKATHWVGLLGTIKYYHTCVNVRPPELHGRMEWGVTPASHPV